MVWLSTSSCWVCTLLTRQAGLVCATRRRSVGAREDVLIPEVRRRKGRQGQDRRRLLN